MNSKPRRFLSNLLLFFVDYLHAWALAVSASILFHCVLETPLSNKTIMIIAAIVIPPVLLFLKSRLFRRILLIVLASGSFALLMVLFFSLFQWYARFLRTTMFRTVTLWALMPEIPALLVVLLALMLSCIAVVHGKRLVYPFVLTPPLALIILSMMSAEFPVAPLVVYTVAAIVLVLRRKYDWFSKLLSAWPTTSELLNRDPSYNVQQEETSSYFVRRGSDGAFPPARKGLGFPNFLLRLVCITLMAALIALLFRPAPTPGPLFGEDFSRSVEYKFQQILESSDFFSRMFGIKTKKSTRTTGTYGTLGGPADLSDDPVLLVKSAQPGVYLRGFTYSDYLGNRWRQESVDKNEPALNGDVYSSSDVVTLPFEDNLIRFGPAWIINYTYYASGVAEKYWNSRRKTVAVQYIDPYDARFGLFVPAGTRAMRFFDQDFTYYKYASALNLKWSTGKNLLYTSGSAQKWVAYEAAYLDYSDETITANKLYEYCRSGYYSNLADSLRTASYYMYENDINELEQLAFYSKNAQEKYTRLSSNVSDRVIALAHEITGGLEEKDDWHKAIAIKNYLLSGKYMYSLSPSELPDGVDILDQFLFNEKMGYCTYFATAMTVLARAAGIPARYVEGFYVSSNTETESGLYMLTEKNLHAWCEIYMEGIGFVPIEATAGFGRRTPVESTPTVVPATATPSPTPTMRPTPGTTEEPTEVVNTPAPTALVTPVPTEEPVYTEPFRLPAAIKILIIVAITAILIAAILLLLNRLATRKPGRSGSASERTASIYRSAAALLKKFGFGRNAADTPREYAASVRNRQTGGRKDLPPGVIDAFDRLTGLYETALYGSGGPDEPPYEEALACWDEIVNALESGRGKLSTRLKLINTIGK